MQLRVVNDSADPLTVQSAVYTDPRFAEAARWAATARFRPALPATCR
ncbi:MAG: hypothetical protein JWP66_1678 [Naasia sp.]|nr:hypothetical protein [Naasia sp.]